MRMHFKLLAGLVLLSLAGLTACAGEKLTMGTGGTAGVYFPLGKAIAELVGKHNPDIEITTQSTGASGENLRLTNANKVNLSIVQNDLADAAFKGEESFPERLTEIRAISRLYPEYLHIVASTESGIKQISDFKGMRVSVGASGSGNEVNCRQIFSFYDVNYTDMKPIFLPYGETADMFKKQQVDVFVFTIGTPNPAIRDLAITKEINFIPVDGSIREQIVKKYPYFARSQIPANSYEGQTEAVETLSVQAMLIANASVSDDGVYAVIKAIFDNHEEFKTTHPKAAEISLQKFNEGVTIPLHPGAKRYYREKGLLKEISNN